MATASMATKLLEMYRAILLAGVVCLLSCRSLVHCEIVAEGQGQEHPSSLSSKRFSSYRGDLGKRAEDDTATNDLDRLVMNDNDINKRYRGFRSGDLGKRAPDDEEAFSLDFGDFDDKRAAFRGGDLGKRHMGERPDEDIDEDKEDTLTSDNGLEKRSRGFRGGDLGKRYSAMGFSRDLGKRPMGFSRDLGKRAMGFSRDLGKRAFGFSRDLGKRAMGFSRDLGKRPFEEDLVKKFASYRGDLGKRYNGMGYRGDLGKRADFDSSFEEGLSAIQDSPSNEEETAKRAAFRAGDLGKRYASFRGGDLGKRAFSFGGYLGKRPTYRGDLGR